MELSADVGDAFRYEGQMSNGYLWLSHQKLLSFIIHQADFGIPHNYAGKMDRDYCLAALSLSFL